MQIGAGQGLFDHARSVGLFQRICQRQCGDDSGMRAKTGDHPVNKGAADKGAGRVVDQNLIG